MFNGVVAALAAGELSSEHGTSGALALVWQINGATEYGYYNFSPETNDMSLATLHEETNSDNLFWGTGKGSVFADTSEATMSLLEKAAAVEAGEDVSFDEEITIYENAAAAQQQQLKAAMDREIAAMNEFAELYR